MESLLRNKKKSFMKNIFCKGLFFFIKSVFHNHDFHPNTITEIVFWKTHSHLPLHYPPLQQLLKHSTINLFTSKCY